MARMMVMKFGMSEKVGHVSYDMDGERPTDELMTKETLREDDSLGSFPPVRISKIGV